LGHLGLGAGRGSLIFDVHPAGEVPFRVVRQHRLEPERGLGERAAQILTADGERPAVAPGDGKRLADRDLDAHVGLRPPHLVGQRLAGLEHADADGERLRADELLDLRVDGLRRERRRGAGRLGRRLVHSRSTASAIW
jgi:hypothetical protein